MSVHSGREISKSKIVQLVSGGVSAAAGYVAGASESAACCTLVGREERRVKDEGARGERRRRGPQKKMGRRWNARLSKEELSAVKNHAPRHHCHGQSAASSICSTYPGSQPIRLPTSPPPPPPVVGRPVKIAQSMTSERTFAPVMLLRAIIDFPCSLRKLLEIIVPRAIIIHGIMNASLCLRHIGVAM